MHRRFPLIAAEKDQRTLRSTANRTSPIINRPPEHPPRLIKAKSTRYKSPKDTEAKNTASPRDSFMPAFIEPNDGAYAAAPVIFLFPYFPRCSSVFFVPPFIPVARCFRPSLRRDGINNARNSISTEFPCKSCDRAPAREIENEWGTGRREMRGGTGAVSIGLN